MLLIIMIIIPDQDKQKGFIKHEEKTKQGLGEDVAKNIFLKCKKI